MWVTWAHLIVGGSVYLTVMAALFYVLFVRADEEHPQADAER